MECCFGDNEMSYTEGIAASDSFCAYGNRELFKKMKSRKMFSNALGNDQFPSVPKVANNVAKRIKARQEKEKLYYYRGAKDLAELKRGEMVRIPRIRQGGTGARKGRIQRKVGIRSYEVVTDEGRVCRRTPFALH